MDEEEQKAAEEAARKEAEQAAAEKEKREAEEARKREAEAGSSEDLKKAQAELERLQSELEAAKAAAKKFDGIDPEAARANAKKVKEAEEAAREAEKAKAKAEGDFEKLKQIQDEEAAAKVAAAEERAAEAEKRANEALSKANVALTEAAFAGSSFLSSETILTGNKGVRLYGDHVEVEDGVVVVYDAPRGASKRAKIMDSKGVPLPFDVAIKKVIEADPDKDSFLKSKAKPGAGSKTTTDDPAEKRSTDRLSRLAAGVAKIRGS